ncbi:hypothetical protein V6C66_14945, partial [Lacticaseibacillus paracasei]|uniref:hypothetical protein n=1 Tax=Lacticaseibacillus paracasei TaxID=1597 RepID=UPI002FDAB7DE
SSARRFEGLGIDNDNTELWKHRGFGTSWLPGGDGFLGECNQRDWLLLRKEAQGFFLGFRSPQTVKPVAFPSL